jgi:hypothetical protein
VPVNELDVAEGHVDRLEPVGNIPSEPDEPGDQDYRRELRGRRQPAGYPEAGIDRIRPGWQDPVEAIVRQRGTDKCTA